MRILFSLFISVGSWLMYQPVTPKKVALIVAIGNYPEGGRWKNLSSANDVKYIKAALIKNGFNEKDIDTLINENATKDAIIKALDKLYEQVQVGDIVYFQFSGHGQQIEDDNEDEADGYDEALVPYNAKAAYDPVMYKGQNHLRDDVLNEKLAKIRAKIGGNGSLVVLLDACHSGTATRGSEFSITRGEATPFQSPEYPTKLKKIRLGAAMAREEGMFSSGKEKAANMIVFSASSPNQVNYETKDLNGLGVGSLSYAFAKALSSMRDGMTYQLLFEKVKAIIQSGIPNQIPLIEGNIAQEVFSGNYSKKEDIISVQRWVNDSTFYINAGMLNSLANGSSVQVYSLEGAAITNAFIKQAGTFQSLCIAAKALKTSEAYNIKIEGVNYGDFSATVFIKTTGGAIPAAIKQQLENYIKPFPFIGLSDNADIMFDIIPTTGNNYKINLIEKGDSVHFSKNIGADGKLSTEDFNYLLDGIKRNVRIKYFRSINDGGVFANDVKLEIIPKKATTGTEIQMKEEDEFSIKITNNSTQILYYTIIDLMPNNDIKVLLPDEADEPADYALRPGESKIIEGVSVDKGTPQGKEFFKAIFTKVPMDLRNILNRKKTRGSGSLQSFEMVVDDMFKESTGGKNTRASVTNVKVEEIGIVTVGFTIIQ